jgi:hypothetical protein
MTGAAGGAVTAADVLQRYLDDIGAAVMEGRFDAYRAGVQLPLNILTSAANLTVATEADLRDGFADFTEMLRQKAVTGMIRIVMEAWYESADSVVGIYETNLISGDQHVVPPFYSKIWLGRSGALWRADKIHNTTQDRRWPLLLARVDPVQWPPKELIQ